jgi:hypothetical protein
MIRAALAASLAVAPVCAADIIFDSYNPTTGSWVWWVMMDAQLGEHSSAMEVPGGFENEKRVAQLITFAGTARHVTTVEAAVFVPANFSTPQRSIGVTLFFYANNGGEPGAVIWSSREVVSASIAQTHHVPVTFSSGVEVPDTMFIAFEYDTYTGLPATQSPGVLLSAQPPFVGVAGPVPLVQDSTTLEWAPDPHSNPNQYVLQARFTAEGSASLCYPNCDGSSTAPALTVADFTCFLTKFAAGDPYANCDNSSVPPVLNIADFSCFLSKFVAGCP